MTSHLNSRSIGLVLAMAGSAALVGCGDDFSGVYTSDAGFFDKLDFTSSDTVEITFMGQTKEATYVVEDEKVKITIDGETQVFTVDDDGCIDGGGIIGKYCKGDAKDSDSKSTSATAKKNDLVGSRYVATSPDGDLGLEFDKNNIVHLTMTGEEPEDAPYAIVGDEIIIDSPDGTSMTLTRADDGALIATMGSMSIRFEKQ